MRLQLAYSVVRRLLQATKHRKLQDNDDEDVTIGCDGPPSAPLRTIKERDATDLGFAGGNGCVYVSW